LPAHVIFDLFHTLVHGADAERDQVEDQVSQLMARRHRSPGISG
jgi:FMN phosphatase YigB (HAD superfamily)